MSFCACRVTGANGNMWAGKPSKGFEDFAPDLAIEIISPSERANDRTEKVAEYFGNGAEQVWHLFPDTKQVTIYYSPLNAAEFEPTDELSAGEMLPGFSCRAEKLFSLE